MLTIANELSKCCFALKYALLSHQICHYRWLFRYILGLALPETFVISLKKYKQARALFNPVREWEFLQMLYRACGFNSVIKMTVIFQMQKAASYYCSDLNTKGGICELILGNIYIYIYIYICFKLFKMACLTKAIITCHSVLSQRCYSRWSVIWPLPPVQM